MLLFLACTSFSYFIDLKSHRLNHEKFRNVKFMFVLGVFNLINICYTITCSRSFTQAVHLISRRKTLWYRNIMILLFFLLKTNRHSFHNTQTSKFNSLTTDYLLIYFKISQTKNIELHQLSNICSCIFLFFCNFLTSQSTYTYTRFNLHIWSKI